MKTLFSFLLVVLVVWYAFTHFLKIEGTTATVNVSSAPVVPPKPAPAPNTPSPAAIVATPPSVGVIKTGSIIRPVAPKANPQEKIDLTAALDPNNHYHDERVGVAVDLPAGWQVGDAFRWGNGNRENTVFLKPDGDTSANPSMYYRQYGETNSSNHLDEANAFLLTQAQEKEDFRIQNGRTDYKNVPESFELSQINGNPSLSYFATFTQGDQVMTEYFVRVLGPTGYVMFFTTGKLDDVKTIMPQVKQMAASLKVP